jgi:AraC-like DNA-binding protein
LLSDLYQIHSNAEHHLRVINDLLDLSRVEIDELDLSLEMLDPHQLLLEAFQSLAGQSTSEDIQWKLNVPDRLPQIRADAVRLRNNEDLETALSTTKLVALAWDLSNAQPGDWPLVRRLRHYPNLSQAPFILYGQLEKDQMGMTGFLVKSSNTETLLDVIIAMSPTQASGPVLIVDDDPKIREAHRELVKNGLPGFPVQLAEDGEKALALMKKNVPVLVLLDLVMPNLSGADVLDQMRADENLCQVPVIILSNKMMTLEDVNRIESHTHVTLQSKGIWSEAETIAAMNRAIFGTDTLPAHTSGLVKQAIAFLHQNYARPVTRWEIADAVGVSDDYISRVFSRELNISPWDYLNRYRILQSKQLLLDTTDTIGSIAHQVGFKDQAYFSRVFLKITGMSPQAFREIS